jgi:hypothetical protein
MANEYLKRTPTSTGNRKVFTISIWSKLNDNSVANTLCDTFTNGSNFLTIRIGNPGTQGAMIYQIDGATDYSRYWEITERDFSGWSHHLFSFNSTSPSASERVCYYLNGIKISNYVDTYGTFPQNFDFKIDTTRSFDIFKNGDQNLYGEGEIFDYFFVDGQALTPDVFGYYKKGDGYISAGSTQATDFKKGQWVPKAPKVIRSVINARGGFGVNGFYLPMNDSSNPGADFHCEPNSIIKLKGEDFNEYPQPRNGAPTTTDAYVSQLRTDPYAANLVLAIPGISIDLITNGTFDSNTTGWTASHAVISAVDGKLKVDDSANAGGWSNAFYVLTTVAGRTYNLEVDVLDGSNSRIVGIYQGTYTANSGTAPSTTVGTYTSPQKVTTSFTATGTSVSIILSVNNDGVVYFDNVKVYDTTPRDYSADIRGSGTNKTLTPAGNAGVGYELGGYYGSAMSFDGTGDFLSVPNTSDLRFDNDDFTIEAWIKTSTTDDQFIFSQWNSGDDRRSYVLWVDGGALNYNGSESGTNSVSGSISANIDVNFDDWCHVAVSKNGVTTRLFANGVCIGINTTSTSLYSNTVDTPIIGGEIDGTREFAGQIQDLRVYKGVAKYKGSFDVPKPYTPVGIESWRTTDDTCSNNFATMNPLIGNYTDSNFFASDGNLSLNVLNNSGYRNYSSTFSPENFKGYLELRYSLGTPNGQIGITDVTKQDTNLQYTSAGTFFIDTSGNLRNGPTTVKSGCTPSFSNGDTLQIAFDFTGTNKNIWFGRNGTWGDNTVGTGNPSSGINPMFTSTELTGDYRFYFGINTGAGTQVVNLNFGQNPSFSGALTAGTFTDDSGKGLFKYAPPTGFLALCEDNLPTPTIADPGDYMRTVLYEGDNTATREVKGVGFQPDLIFFKNRDIDHPWNIFDSVRGSTKQLSFNTTGAEVTRSGGGCFFNENGFSVSNNANNNNANSYVAFCWKAGGAAVLNDAGSIDSQVSANQTAGFSIVFTNGSGTAGHGLNATPQFIISKRTAASSDWSIQHHKMMTSSTGKLLFSTGGVVASSTPYMFNANDTTFEPVYTDPCISYCWSEIEGFSKFGSYIGNGDADGPFVYCGFKPAFIMFKNASASGNWVMSDSSRDSSNPVFGYQVAESGAIEERGTALFDSLSNGFKIRNAWTSFNGNTNTIIFMAFAESPFQTANAK